MTQGRLNGFMAAGFAATYVCGALAILAIGAPAIELLRPLLLKVLGIVGLVAFAVFLFGRFAPASGRSGLTGSSSQVYPRF